MLISIDANGTEPLFEQIASEIRHQISSGLVGAGQRLPSARDLSEALEINIHTVLRAYQELRDEGLITMRPGRGAQVVAPPRELSEIERLLSEAVRLAREHQIQSPTLISHVKSLYKQKESSS